MTIDSFVWFALVFVAAVPVAAATGQLETAAGSVNADLEGTPALAASALWLALGVGYHTVLEWRFGKTLGKYLVGIGVRNDDGSPLSFRSSLVRNVLRVVDFLPAFYLVGIAALLLSEEYQRVGDRLGNTVVVRL
jgi:uncharacterized RDD family membrane protein YckC